MRLRGDVRLAKSLRRRMTPPEIRLWVRLRARAVHGLTFRRQHPCGRYILDFYCADAKFAIEVDGFVHEVADHPARDADRDAWLLLQGVAVHRIPAKAVFDDVDAVADTVIALAREIVEARR